ncbi:putative invertase inhibitor [Malania oleifera]|uniref:putative invertase inhibitor n=1 Tax=Malania oleifera TaxID=397392 RepID=UPI0025AEB78E|nr:putative invertase inhibitor [Malania oleifera]
MKPSILSLFIVLSFFFLYGANGDKHLIEKVCKDYVQKNTNSNYSFCMSSLENVPKSRNASLRGLGFISITLVKSDAIRIQKLIKRLLNNSWTGKMDPYAKDHLVDCQKMYSDAVYTVSKAAPAFRVRDYDSANVYVSAVMDTSYDCENGYSERQGYRSPLTKSNAHMFELSAVALSIINMAGHIITK